MKRFLILTVLVLLPVLACAQSAINYKDTATLVWDEITTDENNLPLAPADTVAYDIFVYNSALTVDDQNLANIILMGSSNSNEFILNFADFDRAMYWAGVRSVITQESGNIVYSEIAWSYEEVATDNAPFGYIPLQGVLVVPAPSGLQDSGI